MFRHTLLAAAAVAFLFAGSASAQKLDANGKCHDASGKFAKAEVCGGSSAKTASAAAPTKTASAKPAKPAKSATTAAAAATPAAATAKAAPTKCKDAKGKYAKCGTPGATPA